MCNNCSEVFSFFAEADDPAVSFRNTYNDSLLDWTKSRFFSWKSLSDTTNETKAISLLGISPTPSQSLYTFFLGVKVLQPGRGVLLGDGVAKDVSL